MTVQAFSRKPLRVNWGEGSVARLAEELDRVGSRRPMVVCTPSVARNGDLLHLIERSARRALSGVVSDVRPHSPIETVRMVAGRLASADSVVVVGGGSAIVTARAANILCCEGGDVEMLATRRDTGGGLTSPRLTARKLPMVIVPTTPTTAAPKAGAAVTRQGAASRLALFDPAARARCVIIDPELTAGAPVTVTRDAALNALVMAFEGLTTRRRNLFADAALGHAARQLPARIGMLATRPNDSALRVELALLAVLVGDGTDSSGGGLTAALSHSVGHRVQAHNGVVDALLLPHVLRLVTRRDPSALASIAELLAVVPMDVTQAVEEILAPLSKLRTLRELGVLEDDLPLLVGAAMDDFASRGATFRVEDRDVERLLKEAL
ncbi:iron-containing alcohol dehydrogenase family protein [Streptomyces sp. NPDC096310]|uniref:iron-containing alcohol dehydrogenase family protein n=1 Tax=Streptomyces sp. NPDC096310 TaxID=3366082 RepID=UPI0037FF4681